MNRIVDQERRLYLEIYFSQILYDGGKKKKFGHPNCVLREKRALCSYLATASLLMMMQDLIREAVAQVSISCLLSYGPFSRYRSQPRSNNERIELLASFAPCHDAVANVINLCSRRAAQGIDPLVHECIREHISITQFGCGMVLVIIQQALSSSLQKKTKHFSLFGELFKTAYFAWSEDWHNSN